jgi:DNA-binding transcriptional ArsR family regulator
LFEFIAGIPETRWASRRTAKVFEDNGENDKRLRRRLDQFITYKLYEFMQSASDLLFRTLGDPTRRAIFEHLASGGERNVRALTAFAGVSQPAVSKHLAVLKLAGLVRDRPEGRETHYSAEFKGLAPLLDWMEHYGAFWRDRFDRLENLLNRMDQ